MVRVEVRLSKYMAKLSFGSAFYCVNLVSINMVCLWCSPPPLHLSPVQQPWHNTNKIANIQLLCLDQKKWVRKLICCYLCRGALENVLKGFDKAMHSNHTYLCTARGFLGHMLPCSHLFKYCNYHGSWIICGNYVCVKHASTAQIMGFTTESLPCTVAKNYAILWNV